MDESDLPAVKAPLPDAETRRLHLRRFQPGDVEALTPVFAKPEVWAYSYGRGFTPDETAAFVATQVEEWDRCSFGLWLAIEKVSGRTLGYVGLSVLRFFPDILGAVEVGWRLDPDAWGRGYATEGAAAALGEAFGTLGLVRVCAVTQIDNLASRRVCERLGMVSERVVGLAPTAHRGPAEVSVYWTTKDGWNAWAPRRAAEEQARANNQGTS